MLRRGGQGSEPAPAGAAPRPAAPMGGRAGPGAAAAAHVASQDGGLTGPSCEGGCGAGGGGRLLREATGAGGACLASPPRWVRGSFRRGRQASPCCGARAAEAPQRSGVIMLAEVRALPGPRGAGGEGAPLCPPELRAAAERRLCPQPGPPTCLDSRQAAATLAEQRRQPARSGQRRAPFITPPPSPAGCCLFPLQGGMGGRRFSAAVEPARLWLLRAAAGRGGPALPRDPPAAGLCRR